MTDKINKDGSDRKKPGTKIVVFGSKEAEILENGSSLSQRDIASQVGISVSCLHSVFRRQPDMRLIWSRGRAAVVHEMTNLLLEQCRNGNIPSLIFFAKTQNPLFQSQEVKDYIKELEEALMETHDGETKLKSIIHRYDGSLPSDIFPEYYYADKKGGTDEKKLNS